MYVPCLLIGLYSNSVVLTSPLVICKKIVAIAIYVFLQPVNVTRFAKRGLIYTHSFKTHFSLPSVSYINAPTAHVFNTAEG